MRNKFILGLFLAFMAAALPPQVSFAADTVTPEEVAAPPDATISFEARQVRVIFGGGSGTGVLHFKGKNYPFTLKAASVGGMGATDVAGVGKVYHLTKVEDFAGAYAAVGIGAAIGEGKGASAFKNSNGVVVQTKAKSTGLALNLGVGRVEITMKK